MKKIYLILWLCLFSLCSHAQENNARQIFNQAESEYDVGRIDQAIQLLQDNLEGFEGNLKQSAYRLLALCYMSEDRDEEARYYAEQLIKLNNYYNSTDDPARFQDIINQLKEGIVTTITTASSQSETVNEAPVPITIITAEMIEELGYNKNLGQILAAYVPGVVEITSFEEEDNLSMHGAYSSGQEFIMIMENGHRLNTRFNNVGLTSYSISTEKIDHIEVLRGPASSLYGNVALSAVVNIITKSGRTAEGVKVKYGYGSFNTHRADLTMGTQFMDADIFAWASIYYSDGQKRRFGDGKGYILNSHVFTPVEEYGLYKNTYYGPDRFYLAGYKDAPAYDFGVTFRLRGFDLMFSKKNVKKVLPKTMNYGGYEYDRFYAINGVKPGQGSGSTHAEISYTRQFRNVNLNASLYSDWYTLSYYDVEYDSAVFVSPVYGEDETYLQDENGNVIMETNDKGGRFSYSAYKEHTMGGYARASADYLLGNMKGNVLTGVQYEHFSLQSAFVLGGEQYEKVRNVFLNIDEITQAGKEKSLSLFIQDKHYILTRLILNAGFRYDFKYRQEEDVVRNFSPRLALMYVPNERFSLKLSYSEAFADLSFFNRYVSKTEFYTMDPQHLSAIQLTAMGNIPTWHLKYDANLFFNRYSNLMCWQERGEYSGKNIGKLTNIGIEGIARYAYKRLSAYLSLYYCKDLSSDSYYYNKSLKMVCGVPHFTLNLHGALQLLQGKTHELKIYGHSTYSGRQLNFMEEEVDDFYVDGTLLFDFGIKYCYKQWMQFSFDCENIFDTDHYICGPNYQYVPQIQRGRTLMASFSIKI